MRPIGAMIAVLVVGSSGLAPARGAEDERARPEGRLRVLEGAYNRPCLSPRIRSRDWLGLEPVFGERRFRKPVQALPDPARPGFWFVVESEGRVLRVAEAAAGTPNEVVLDLRDRVLAGRQWGLQSIALAPGFPEDPHVFASYTARSSDARLALESRVARFRLSADGATIDPSTEKVLLREGQTKVWHPIAGLRFGPDGMLYVGWGEGGGSRDRTALRGKILRIDVQGDVGPRGYAIPDDNPFRSGPHRPEVFATGFRNPWRFSFDPETAKLWVADVGGRSFEEVSLVASGDDHGWPSREGFSCRLRKGCERDTKRPVLVHSSSSVCAVIGGHVYRGRELPSLRGKYVYGDYCSRVLYAYDPATGATSYVQQLSMDFLVAIEVDADGELYVVEARGQTPDEVRPVHRVHRVKAKAEPPESVRTARHTITALGCEGPEGPTSPPFQMIPYDIVVPAWDGGATARRFVGRGFRPLERADRAIAGRPKVFLKTLFVGDAPIETQMLAVDRAGEWGAWSFAWDDEGKAAEIVTTPTTRRLPNGTEWRFDTALTCFRCHSAAAGRTLGTALAQLDVDGQLERWFDRGIVESDRGRDAYLRSLRGAPPLVDPNDETATLDARARSLLHVQCAPCHRPGGEGGPSSMDLSRGASLARMKVCDVAPRAEYPGLDVTALVAPGHPDGSLLYRRMSAVGSLAMPPTRTTPNPAGAALIREWIDGLASCPPPDHSSSEK